MESVFGSDRAAIALYKELIWNAANSDAFFTDKRGKTTELKRGQVVFGRNVYGEYLGWDGKKCERILEKLENVYKQVTKQANRNFTLVSINNYDEMVSFDQADDQPVSKQRPSNVQAMTTSKSVRVKDRKTGTDKRPTSNPFPLSDEHREYAKSLGFNTADIAEFESYWTEGAETGKARWQYQKVFDVKRRLKWLSGKFGEWGHQEPPKDSQLFVPRFQ